MKSADQYVCLCSDIKDERETQPFMSTKNYKKLCFSLDVLHVQADLAVHQATGSGLELGSPNRRSVNLIYHAPACTCTM